MKRRRIAKDLGSLFNGPIIPFGARIKYKPSKQKDKEAMPKIGDKLLRGIFVGYAQQAGGGWNGDVEVIDAFDLTNAQEVSEVYTKRVSADEIVIDKDVHGDFIFPIISEDWVQPIDGRRMTRRILKNNRLIVDHDLPSRGGETPQEKATRRRWQRPQ